MSIDKRYGVGVVLTLFGCDGIANAVLGQGSIWVASIVFAVGFALILDSYVTKRR